MIQKIFTTLFILTCFSCSAQKVERVIVAHEDPYDLYANIDKDSTTLFYDKLVPKDKPIGVLIILPGSGETIGYVQSEITLHTLAVQKNLLVIFPSLNWGTNKHFAEHQFLDKICKQIVQEYKVPKDKFLIGGFSGGAMIALTYAEKANENKDSTFIKPKAVFGLDPPLDYTHLWNHCVKDLERNFSQAAIQESKSIIDSYRQEFGGSPEEVPQNYIKYSIFSYSQKDGGNAKYLIHTPVLLYTEPDVLWQMEYKHRDFYDMNCVDISAMINLLRLEGNKDAELIVTHDKGRRLDGTRNPHSWSIMDSQQCLDWILQQLNK